MDRCSYILTYTYKVDILNQGCRGRILKHSEIIDYAKANNCLLILQHIICAGESGRISGCSPSCVLPIICLQLLPRILTSNSSSIHGSILYRSHCHTFKSHCASLFCENLHVSHCLRYHSPALGEMDPVRRSRITPLPKGWIIQSDLLRNRA